MHNDFIKQYELKGGIWIDKFFEMINQEFTAQGRKYEMLPNLRICCKELRGLNVTDFAHASAVSALPLSLHTDLKLLMSSCI